METMTIEQAETCTAEMTQMDASVGRQICLEIIALFKRHERLGTGDISDLLDLDRRTVTKRLQFLMRSLLLTKINRSAPYTRTIQMSEFVTWNQNGLVSGVEEMAYRSAPLLKSEKGTGVTDSRQGCRSICHLFYTAN